MATRIFPHKRCNICKEIIEIGGRDRSMQFREVATLQTLCVKTITKRPQPALAEEKVQRALSFSPREATRELRQRLLHAIIEAGRLTDDCVPLSFFDDTFTSLSLSGSKLTGGMIVKIVSICSQLQHLDISSCFQVTNDTLITVLRTCPRLTSLSIRNCRKLSDTTLQYLTENDNLLTKLDIGGNFNFTTAGLLEFLTKAPQLPRFVDLNVSGLPMDDQCLNMLALRCTNLERLGISYIEVPEQLIRDAILRLQKLKELDIAWVASIGVEFFEFLAMNARKLERLNICGVKSATPIALVQLADHKAYHAGLDPEQWTPLRWLNAKFTNVPRPALEQLQITHKELQIVM